MISGRTNAPRARSELVIIGVTEHVYQVSRIRIRLPFSGGDLDGIVDFSHDNHPLLSSLHPSFFFLLYPSGLLHGEGIGRNYELVHDRTNRMPRRFGPPRILISVVIKVFVVLRAHGRTRY